MGDLIDFTTRKKIKRTRRKSSPIDYTLNLLNKNKQDYKFMIVIARDFKGNEVRYQSTNLDEVTAYDLVHTLMCSVVKDLLNDKDRND